MTYNNSVRPSQKILYVSGTEANGVIVSREISAVYCEILTKHIDALCRQNTEF
jgi:hypothetical protein